jgi:hypothetical protein
MTTSSLDLLRLLGSGVRPDGGASVGASRSARTSGPNVSVESLDFGALLQKARAGALSSGRPVEVEAGANVSLTGPQLERLARAADAAEAAGATRLLAMIDGQSVVVDVTTRSVTGAFSGTAEAGLLTNIDAAVVIGPDGASGEPGAILPITAPDGPRSAIPLGRVENRAIANMLERFEGALRAR